MQETFKREERLKARSDFKTLYAKGKRVRLKNVKLIFLTNGMKINRVGFPVGKKNGNAVKRNKEKRLNREAYRRIKGFLGVGYDFLLAVYAPLSVEERKAAFIEVFINAGMLLREGKVSFEKSSGGKENVS